MAEAFGSLLPRRADGLRVLEAKMLLVLSGGGSATVGLLYTGSGSPEGAVSAPVGSEYNQIDAGVYNRTWIKQTGSGNTGWA